MTAPDALTASALTASEVKALLFWERPDDVAMLQRVADGLRALDTDHPTMS